MHPIHRRKRSSFFFRKRRPSGKSWKFFGEYTERQQKKEAWKWTMFGLGTMIHLCLNVLELMSIYAQRWVLPNILDLETNKLTSSVDAIIWNYEWPTHWPTRIGARRCYQIKIYFTSVSLCMYVYTKNGEMLVYFFFFFFSTKWKSKKNVSFYEDI